MATDPHATDSLAGLMRELLTTDEPLSVYQEISCATLNLYHRLGSAEADLRVKGVIDTIYKTRADTIAKEQAEAKMRGGVTHTGSFFCDSLATARKKQRADSPARRSR